MRLHVFKLILDAMRQWARCDPASRSPHCVALRQRAVWSAPLNVGEGVCCERGIVWLTQSGDTRDYLLRAGECFTVTRRGRIVAQAMEESLLRVGEAGR